MNKTLYSILEEELIRQEYKDSKILQTGENYEEVRGRVIRAAEGIRKAERRLRRRKFRQVAAPIAVCVILISAISAMFGIREAYAKQFCFVFSQDGSDLNYTIANVPKDGRIRKVTSPQYIPEGYKPLESREEYTVYCNETGASLLFQNMQGELVSYNCDTLNTGGTIWLQYVAEFHSVSDLDGDAYMVHYKDGSILLIWIDEKNESYNRLKTDCLNEEELLRIAKSCR